MKSFYSLTRMQEAFKERFPDKELLEYDGYSNPCVIKCAQHSEQTVSTFKSVYNSKYGCPRCGEEAQKKKASQRMAEVHAKTRDSNLQLNTATFQPWSKPEDPDPEEFVFVPFHKDIALVIGSGKLNSYSQLTFKLPFGRATLHRYGIQFDKAVCCTVSGDSMVPMLPDGTTVGIDTCNTDIKDGDTYAIVQDGLARVKILSLEPGNKVRIHSLNPMYQDEVADLDTVQIVGRVFWYSALI